MNPQERNLSGIYTRIKRDGKYQSVDIADMTPEELEEFLNKEGLTIEYFRRLTQNLIEVVQEIADKFDIEVDEELFELKDQTVVIQQEGKFSELLIGGKLIKNVTSIKMEKLGAGTLSNFKFGILADEIIIRKKGQ